MKILTQTSVRLLNLSVLLLRCTAGMIVFGAGAGKILKWFGGFGLDMTVKYFAAIGISAPLAYISSFTEFIGGFLLIAGLFTRPAAFALAINMTVATIITLPKGFFVGMAGYPFSIMMTMIVILLTGPMAYSIDAMLLQNQRMTLDVGQTQL